MKKNYVGNDYCTVEDESLSLASLLPEEKEFLEKVAAKRRVGESYLNLENFLVESYPIFFKHAHSEKKDVEDTVLFKIAQDLTKRLGIQQGFLKQEEVIKKIGSTLKRKEFTTGEVAKLANCTHEAVRKAIRAGRLPARRVNHFSLVWEEDAKCFAKSHQERYPDKSKQRVLTETKQLVQESVACVKSHDRN